jgi:hypothetical protein
VMPWVSSADANNLCSQLFLTFPRCLWLQWNGDAWGECYAPFLCANYWTDLPGSLPSVGTQLLVVFFFTSTHVRLSRYSLVFSGEHTPEELRRGDWRLLTEDEKADASRIIDVGESGSCIQVPPGGWSSRIDHLSQMTDKRSPRALGIGTRQRRST